MTLEKWQSRSRVFWIFWPSSEFLGTWVSSGFRRWRFQSHDTGSQLSGFSVVVRVEKPPETGFLVYWCWVHSERIGTEIRRYHDPLDLLSTTGNTRYPIYPHDAELVLSFGEGHSTLKTYGMKIKLMETWKHDVKVSIVALAMMNILNGLRGWVK